VLWGAWVILFPNHLFDWTGIDRPNYPGIWQCVGMIVGVYGIGYWVAANDFRRHWPIVLVGFLGKILGPIGFLQSALTGVLPWSWGITILSNDLVWWIPFAAMLYYTFKDWSDPAARYPHPNTHASVREANAGAICSDGRSLSQVSKSGKTMVLFLRHAGCTFCREALVELRKTLPTIEAKGITPVIVHMSSPEEGLQFLANYGLPKLLHVSDPSCSLYRAYELDRGRFEQLLGPKVWWRGFRAAIVKGFGVGKLSGDGFQLGGAFLIQDDKILEAHRSDSAADSAPFSSLSCSL